MICCELLDGCDFEYAIERSVVSRRRGVVYSSIVSIARKVWGRSRRRQGMRGYLDGGRISFTDKLKRKKEERCFNGVDLQPS